MVLGVLKPVDHEFECEHADKSVRRVMQLHYLSCFYLLPEKNISLECLIDFKGYKSFNLVLNCVC